MKLLLLMRIRLVKDSTKEDSTIAIPDETLITDYCFWTLNPNLCSVVNSTIAIPDETLITDEKKKMRWVSQKKKV